MLEAHTLVGCLMLGKVKRPSARSRTWVGTIPSTNRGWRRLLLQQQLVSLCPFWLSEDVPGQADQ